MPSFDIPKVNQRIAESIPQLSALLKAVSKMDYTGYSEIPVGALKADVDLNNKLTLKVWNGSSWDNIVKLLHDVETVDGYSAAVTAQGNTIAVRDANGKLKGDILGNANTATTASALSATLPVNKGGTGGVTAAAARQNLDVPSKADLTATNAAVVAAQTTANTAKSVTDKVSTTPSVGAIPQAGSDGKIPNGFVNLPPDASTIVKGILKTATPQQVANRTANDVAVTPATLPPEVSSISIGIIVQGMWAKAPSNDYMICNGGLALFADYPKLKEAYNLGILQVGGAAGFTQYGSTGLYVPNLSALFLQAVTSDAGGKNSAGLPNIRGSARWAVNGFISSAAAYSGALSLDTGDVAGMTAGSNMHTNTTVDFDASDSDSIYGRASTVMPASAKLLTCVYLGKHS